MLALPIGWEREHNEQTAGLRTFPLVSVATCAYISAGSYLFTSDESQARVIQGLITGMGFIGGGAIIKHGGNVTGTATAASLWSVGAIGLCVAAGLLELAVILCLVTFLILRISKSGKDKLGNNDS